MRNLSVSSLFQLKNECIINAEHICQNCFSGVFYLLNSRNELFAADLNDKTVKQLNFSWKSETKNELVAAAIYFAMDEMGVCIAFKNGDIVMFDCENESCTCVASISAGISTVSCSPDQELIVIVTNDGKFILMDKMFDPICEKTIDVSEFGAGEAVNVGWGSKQTQFHGSEGKEAAKQQVKPVSPALSTDDRRVRVDWKSDGLIFATTTIDPNKRKLNIKIRMWNRDGELNYTSEDVDGLEHLISWKPAANLLASAQQLPNKHQIVFFEKNGLRHGEFTLPHSPGSLLIQHISWSPDSALLCLVATERKENCDIQILMIWSSSNYHWYQKQTFPFENTKVTAVLWDSLSPMKLLVVTNEGNIINYQWSWEITSSDDTVAVIDGSKLLVTSFERNVIPPPMCGWTVNFDKPINKVSLNSTRLVACLSNGAVVTYSFCQNECDKPRNGCILSVNSQSKEMSGDHCNFDVNNNLEKYLIRYCFLTDENSILFIATLDLVSDELICVKSTKDFTSLIKFPAQVLSACWVSDDNSILIQQSDGAIFIYCLDNGSYKHWKDDRDKDVRFTQLCPTMKVAVVNKRKRVFGLSTRFTLFCDNITLVTNRCISFSIHNKQFLLFTTTDHFLRCWSLDCDIVSHLQADPETEEKRNIERGSRIVTSVCKDAKVILQAPRGNLETVFPRLIILQRIKDCLDELSYQEAFSTMRKHRINLNLIVDHDVESFLKNVDSIVSQIGSSDIMNICLLLTELAEENVCISMYNYAYKNYVPYNSSQSKLDLICDTFQQRLKSLDAKKYLLPILVTFVKKSIPQFGEALLEIKTLDDPKDRESALKYLLYLVDINRLYDEALGTYDFDVVLMVAQQSNKDPKEYLSFVKDLQAIEPQHYRNFKIDLHLKRYEKAILNLSLCEGDQYFDECLDLIDKHRLYKQALKLFSDTKSQRVWKKYGDYLLVKKYFEEAAVAFKFSQDYNSALKAYQLSGNWNAAIDVSKFLNDYNHISLFRSLAENLKSAGKFQEAAYIHEVHLSDIQEAATVYIKGHLWDHASRLINQLNNETLKVTLKEELLEHCEFMHNFISQNEGAISKYVNRFAIVSKARLESANQANDDFDDGCDTISDVSSLSESRSVSGSLSTRRSAKSKKKRERKQYSLKEGSRNEYEALLFTIKEVVGKVDSVQEEVSLLIRTLFCYEFEAEATDVQTLFSRLLKVIEASISQVWPSEDPNVAEMSVNQRMKLHLMSNKPLCSEPQLLVVPQLRKINWKFALISE